MPLDPSISLGVTPQQQRDPLATINSLMELQLRNNQNAQFQQQFAARKAMGPIFQQSVDPVTGEIDYDKALSIAARTPAAAFLVPEMANTIAQRKLTQTQMQGAQLEQAGKVFGGVSGIFADAIAAPDPAQAINARLPAYVATLPKEQQPAAMRAAQSFISTIPANANADQVRQWLSPFAMAAKTGSDTIEAQRGKIIPVDTGSGIKLTQVSPLTGTAMQVGATIPKGVTPDTAVTMQKVGVDAEGHDIMAPKGSVGVGTAGAGKAAGAVVAGQNGPGVITKGGNVASLNPQEIKSQEAFGEYEAELNQTVSGILPQMQRIQYERQAMKMAQTNGWGEARMGIAKMLQGAAAAGVPIPQSLIDGVANGSIKDSQTFSALSATQSAAQYQTLAKGTGRGFMLEYSTLKDKYPTMNSDPAMAEQFYNQQAALYQKYYVQQQDLMQFKQDLATGKLPAGTKITDFPALENRKLFEGGKLFNQEVGGAKGVSKEGKSQVGKPARKSLDEIFGGGQ